MIIKSMARKAPTFAQLIAYIDKDADELSAFSHNLYHTGEDLELVKDQFLQNYRYLPQRKNGNALYHEILALEPQPHLSKEEIETRLQSLAKIWCVNRAPNNLAWGKVHHDTDFPHVHLMISANEVYSRTRKRLSREDFLQLQKEVEYQAQQVFQDLHITPVYNRSIESNQNQPKLRWKEASQIAKTGKLSKKQIIAGAVCNIFASAHSLQNITEQLKDQNLRLYQRGQIYGIEDQHTGQRYRFKTLGLDVQFLKFIQKPAPSKPTPSKPTPPKTKAKPEIKSVQQQRLEDLAQDRASL